LAGVFSLQKLLEDKRAVSEISRSEIAFALRVIPSHLSEFAHLAPVVGSFRASVDDASSVEHWEQLRRRIQEDDLGNVCCEHCLLDGRTVQSLLGVKGIEIAQSIHLILQARTELRCCSLLLFCLCSHPFQWQFNHRGCTKEDMLAAVTANRLDFGGK
jgi:hypothetical protein